MGFKEFSVDRISDITESLGKVAEDFITRVASEHDQRSISWDYIRSEIWEDSGRIIFYPASFVSNDRIDRAGNFIYCRELKDKVSAIDSSELSDESADMKYQELVQGIARLVDRSAMTEMKYEIRCFNQDGEQIEI